MLNVINWVHRNDVRVLMKELCPEGFIIRHPDFRTTKIHNGKVISIGPGEGWSCDGHEKLKQMGYSIYGIRDVWGKILAYRLVPNARNEHIAEYVYLCAVREAGGESCALNS